MNKFNTNDAAFDTKTGTEVEIAGYEKGWFTVIDQNGRLQKRRAKELAPISADGGVEMSDLTGASPLSSDTAPATDAPVDTDEADEDDDEGTDGQLGWVVCPDKSRYTTEKTPSGKIAQFTPDMVGQMLKECEDPQDYIAIMEKHGYTEARAWVEEYQSRGRNPGMVRMNVGNRFRAHLRAVAEMAG